MFTTRFACVRCLQSHVYSVFSSIVYTHWSFVFPFIFAALSDITFLGRLFDCSCIQYLSRTAPVVRKSIYVLSYSTQSWPAEASESPIIQSADVYTVTYTRMQHIFSLFVISPASLLATTVDVGVAPGHVWGLFSTSGSSDNTCARLLFTSGYRRARLVNSAVIFSGVFGLIISRNPSSELLYWCTYVQCCFYLDVNFQMYSLNLSLCKD